MSYDKNKTIPRWRVKVSFPGMTSNYMINKGDIVMDDGRSVVRNQNGRPVRPIKWDDYPDIFEKIDPCSMEDYEATIPIWLDEK